MGKDISSRISLVLLSFEHPRAIFPVFLP